MVLKYRQGENYWDGYSGGAGAAAGRAGRSGGAGDVMQLRLTEKREQEADYSASPKIKLSYAPADTGDSFGSLQGTTYRPNAGRGGVADIEPENTYSLAKGIAGGVQKGLTGIAQIGGNMAAMLEDVQYAPLEVISGKKIGELADKGFMNRWNDSIDRAADRVEDYYSDNIVAGGTGAEFLDKLVEKSVSLVPQVLYTAYTGGAGAAPELTKVASRELPGTLASIRTVAENLASDPWYWFSAAGTAGEGYQDAAEDAPPENAADWRRNVAQSAGKGLYKEAIGTSEEIPDVLSTLAEIAYEMYEERRVDQPDDSVLNRALNGLMKILWD